MDDTTMMYFGMSMVIIFIVAANFGTFGGGIYGYGVILICILGVVFLLMMTFADFIVFPLMTGLFGITFQPSRNYKITRGQEAVIKNVNGLYYATGYLTANLFAHTFKAEAAPEGEDERRMVAPENWEKAVMSLDFPFKFHVMSSALDVQQVRDELEGKRSYQEFQMSRAMQSKNTTEVIMADLQRNINVIQAKMDRISQEEKPIANLMYIETTAVGVSEKAALDNLSAQLKQLSIAMGVLDVQILRVVGRELYTLFKFSFALPTTYEELSSNFDIQQ